VKAGRPDAAAADKRASGLTELPRGVQTNSAEVEITRNSTDGKSAFRGSDYFTTLNPDALSIRAMAAASF
jgi:hypothetical protein